MSLLRTMKSQFIAGLITAPLFVVVSFFLFCPVLQFAESSKPVVAAVAIPSLVAYSIFDTWLTGQLLRRWSQQAQRDARQ